MELELPSFAAHHRFLLQAKKKEEEGVSEAKHTFEREQGNMRQEVDLALSKIRCYTFPGAGGAWKTGNRIVKTPAATQSSTTSSPKAFKTRQTRFFIVLHTTILHCCGAPRMQRPLPGTLPGLRNDGC